MTELRSDFGVLTNGEELRLYQRGQSAALIEVQLGSLTESQAFDLTSALQKRAFGITDPEDVNDYLKGFNSVPLNSELGQEHFFDTFRLEKSSPFADLITGLMDLLTKLCDGEKAEFGEDAYDLCEATYASESDEVPELWGSDGETLL